MSISLATFPMLRVVSTLPFILFLSILSITSDAQVRTRGANWPVPTFNAPADKPIQREIADLLRTAYEDLHSHLCSLPAPVTNEWKQTYRDLATRMVIAQHKAIWAADGSVRAGNEGNELQGFYDLKREMSTMLERAARDNPNQVRDLIAIRDRFNSDTDSLQAAVERVGFGGSILTTFAFRVVVRQFEKDLTGPVPARLGLTNRLTQFRISAHRGLDRLQFAAYERTETDINRFRNSSGKEFAIFKMVPTDLFMPRSWVNTDLFGEVMNAFFRTIGRPYQDLGWQATDIYSNGDFNYASGLILLGPCSQSVIRIIYTLSRESDARRVERRLKDNGFDVEMSKHKDGPTLFSSGEFFYYRNGSLEKASSIANLIKDIELVTPIRLEDAHNEIDYALWIVEQKPRQPLHGTWISDDSAGKWYIGIRSEGEGFFWSGLNYHGTSELGWYHNSGRYSVLESDFIYYREKRACFVQNPWKLKDNEVDHRLRFSADRKSFVKEFRNGSCDANLNYIVSDGWTSDKTMSLYKKISDEVPEKIHGVPR